MLAAGFHVRKVRLSGAIAGTSMVVKVVIKNKDFVRSQRTLKRLARSIDDMRPVNKKASIVLDRWVLRNFQTEGGSVGGWKDLKAGGRYKKSVTGRKTFAGVTINKGITKTTFSTNYKILQDTGALRRSFSPFYSRFNAGIGSNLPYSKKHEFGDKAKKLPRRRMLPTHKDVDDDMILLYSNHVFQSIKKS